METRDDAAGERARLTRTSNTRRVLIGAAAGWLGLFGVVAADEFTGARQRKRKNNNRNKNQSNATSIGQGGAGGSGASGGNVIVDCPFPPFC